jgi:hypothetical protein
MHLQILQALLSFAPLQTQPGNFVTNSAGLIFQVLDFSLARVGAGFGLGSFG